MFGLAVRDTQCGFKMARGDVARSLFASIRETGYLVDLELLLLAEKKGYRVEEVPVAWQEMPGSKVSLWKAAWPVAAGLWRLHRRWRGWRGEGKTIGRPHHSHRTAAGMSRRSKVSVRD